MLFFIVLGPDSDVIVVLIRHQKCVQHHGELRDREDTASHQQQITLPHCFNLGPFNTNKSPFRCPYVVNPFEVAGRNYLH